MGRNDLSSMDFIFILQKKVKKYSIVALILLILPLLDLNAQYDNTANTGDNNDDQAITYVIKPKYQVNIVHFGRFTDFTNVKRVYDDGSEIEYERAVTYYYTLQQPAASEEGFTMLKVVIDSLVYDFKSGNYNLKFNSMWDEVPPLNKPDYLTVAIPQSKAFEMTYTPYGEVAKIEGKLLENYRLDIEDIEDSLQLFYYTRYTDDEILSNIVDFQRGSIPGFAVSLDTSWKSNVRFIIDGVTVKGQATGKLADQVNGKYFLKLTADSLDAQPQLAYKYGISNAIPVINDGNASLEYNMEFMPGGLLNFAQAKIKGVFEGNIKNMKFKDYTETSQAWEIIESYRW